MSIDTDKNNIQIFTLQDCLQWGVDLLDKQFVEDALYLGHGFDSTWDEALAIIFSVMDLPWTSNDSVLSLKPSEKQKQEIIERFKKRAFDRIPIAYVNKESWFAGLPFYVDERVLIPRSPIAELIEDGFSLWLGHAPPERILDLCTGSACLAIACALTFENAEVDASDISVEALNVAQINQQRYQLEQRLHLIESDLFKNLQGKRYDLIISNPPYVDALDMSELPPEYLHEPRMALVAGEDGLRFVDSILKQAAQHLTDRGLLIVEVGNSEQALIEKYPHLPFLWLEFERGGQGVFVLSRQQLEQFQQADQP